MAEKPGVGCWNGQVMAGGQAEGKARDSAEGLGGRWVTGTMDGAVCLAAGPEEVERRASARGTGVRFWKGAGCWAGAVSEGQGAAVTGNRVTGAEGFAGTTGGTVCRVAEPEVLDLGVGSRAGRDAGWWGQAVAGTRGEELGSAAGAEDWARAAVCWTAAATDDAEAATDAGAVSGTSRRATCWVVLAEDPTPGARCWAGRRENQALGAAGCEKQAWAS